MNVILCIVQSSGTWNMLTAIFQIPQYFFCFFSSRCWWSISIIYYNKANDYLSCT